MGDPEQPGSKRRRLLQILQRHESPEQSVLHDVLAVDDRSHEAGAIAVQLGPHFGRPGRGAAPGGRGSRKAVLRSSRRSLEDGDPRIALEPEGQALGILRIVQHGDNFLAELPGRHRHAEALQELCGLNA